MLQKTSLAVQSHKDNFAFCASVMIDTSVSLLCCLTGEQLDWYLAAGTLVFSVAGGSLSAGNASANNCSTGTCGTTTTSSEDKLIGAQGGMSQVSSTAPLHISPCVVPCCLKVSL